MTDRNDELDLELKWEIERMRNEGYELIAIVFTNRERDARLITTIDADSDVAALLTFLLNTFDKAQKVAYTAAH